MSAQSPRRIRTIRSRSIIWTRSRPLGRVLLAGAAVASLVTAQAAVADTEVQTNIQAGLSGVHMQVGPTGPLSDSVMGTGAGGLATSSAFAQADFGPLEVTHESNAVATENTAGFATAIFRDDVTITPDDPLLNATEGRIVFVLRPLGLLRHDPTGVDPANDSADGLASWRVAVTGAEVPSEYTGQLDLDPGPGGFGFVEEFVGTSLGTPIVFERIVFFGFPSELEVVLTTQTAAFVTDFAPTQAIYRAFAGAAMAWDGILEVQDRFGNVIADYTVTSGSGTDWSQPVPEPGVPLALALAFGAVALAARARRSRSSAGRASGYCGD